MFSFCHFLRHLVELSTHFFLSSSQNGELYSPLPLQLFLFLTLIWILSLLFLFDKQAASLCGVSIQTYRQSLIRARNILNVCEPTSISQLAVRFGWVSLLSLSFAWHISPFLHRCTGLESDAEIVLKKFKEHFLSQTHPSRQSYTNFSSPVFSLGFFFLSCFVFFLFKYGIQKIQYSCILLDCKTTEH